MTKVRDAFADEQSYFTFQKHLLEMERRERLQAAQSNQVRRRGEKSPLTRSQVAIRRMRQREINQRWYYQDVERSRALNRASYYRRRAANPEPFRQYDRTKYMRHREEIRMRAAVYYRDHREEKIDHMRAYYATHQEERIAKAREYRVAHTEELRARRRAKKVATNPFSVSQTERLERARSFEKAVVELRVTGLTFRQIGERLGRPTNSCRNAYNRAMKRQQRQREEQAS